VSVELFGITFSTHSLSKFTNNTAKTYGGALYLSENFTVIFSDGSDVTFSKNTAFGYGAAIYGIISDNFKNKIILNTTNIHFYNNTTPVGESIYVHVSSSCDDLCVDNSIVGHVTSLEYRQLGNYINTPHSKLELYDPAACVINSGDT